MDREEREENKISTSKDLALAIKKHVIVVIKISASWCSPCKNKKFLESYQKLKFTYSKVPDIKFIELDIDDDVDIIENKKYYDIDVNSVPTFLITKNGSFTKKYIGGGYLDDINKYIMETFN
jgi:thiol-disulfide isomerase/thioredoxin